VVTPEGGSLLMDCGWPGKRDADRIAATAKAAGLTRSTTTSRATSHTDHWGSIAELSERIPIAKYYHHAFPEGAKDVEAKIKSAYLKVSAGKSVVVEAGTRCRSRARASRS
jgi:glyoxylase-like metal-dependent hydrolase (beta-lactamase superfamily II)